MNKQEIDDEIIFAQCAILKELSKEDIKFVYEQSDRVAFKGAETLADRIIFEKGDAGNCLYILMVQLI